MLTSITPLGERSRGFSWPVTAAWFAAGAILAGAGAGAVVGGIGSLLPAGQWRTGLLVLGVIVAVGFDATPLIERLPSTRRQVNEDWLVRYRGWVYGGAFGAQLGVGLSTIVTSAAIYAAGLGVALCGSITAGAMIGGAFGSTRALSLVPAASVSDHAGLVRIYRRSTRLQAWARRTVVISELAAIGLMVGGLI